MVGTLSRVGTTQKLQYPGYVCADVGGRELDVDSYCRHTIITDVCQAYLFASIFYRPPDNDDDRILQRGGVRALLFGGIYHDLRLLDAGKYHGVRQGAQVSPAGSLAPDGVHQPWHMCQPRPHRRGVYVLVVYSSCFWRK